MSAFDQLVEHQRESALLQSVSATVEWDERIKMPAAAGSYRAEQLTLLAGMIHARQTDPRLGDLLAEAEIEVASEPAAGDRAATVRELRREFDKQNKLPKSLVEQLTKVSIEGQQAWVEARKQSKFELLQPYLTQTIKLLQEKAQAVGYEDCMYDALLDDYEPGEKTARVRQLFEKLRDALVPLLQAIVESEKTTPVELLSRHYPKSGQQSFGRLAAEKIGYLFSDGRLDETNHPFCTTLGPHDVRITTRYDEDFFSSAFFGTLHEAGHAIYEQGLRKEQFGLPPGKHCSMAIHESQSRLWENQVGRSRPFWSHFFPQLKNTFSESLADVTEDNFFRAINTVQPSLIRVEADEVTYNLHIIIRFELEQEMINGDLAVADLPAAWNDRYARILGVNPPDDADGVLQDIHWPASYIGYFPTYALGNLYAAQFYDQAAKDLGDLESQIAAGEFEPLREWLRKKIHIQGQTMSAAELVQSITGQGLSELPLIAQLQKKCGEVYSL